MTHTWPLALLACTAITSFSAAAEDAPPPPQPDPTLSAYLACINAEAQKQVSEGSDKINNAQRVIDACADKKQALLGAINEAVASQMIAQVEKHLKEREQNPTAP